MAKTLTNPHPVVAAWIAEDQRQRAYQSRWGGSSVRRATALERRRLRILSALYKTLEASGVSIACERNAHFAEFRHERERASFDLKEYVAQKRRPLSDRERAESWNPNRAYRVEQTPTGRLRGRIEAYLPAGVPVMWTETEERSFESFLGEIAATIFTVLADAKARRERCEEQERIRREQHDAARRREEAEKADRARKEALRRRAKDWRRAQDLRAYVAAVQTAALEGRIAAEGQELETWSAWALAHARELDPVSAGDALATTDR